MEINGHAQIPGLSHQGDLITGHSSQHTKGQETVQREVTNSRNRHQQLITHVAEVHHRGGPDQRPQRHHHHSNISSNGSTNNITSSNNNIYNQHRRDRQRLARRQDDSTTTDEDIATQSRLQRSRLHTLTPRGRHRSASRDSSGRIKPRSRSTSSSRQQGSSSRGQGQERVFLTVPVEYPNQSQQERGRTPRLHAASRENTANSGQRSSSSSVSPQHQYNHLSRHQQLQRQQQQSRVRQNNASWRAPHRQDSYNTDTSTTESTIGRRDQPGSSTRTESTLIINGKMISSTVSPKLLNTMVIEDTLASSPDKRYKDKGRHSQDPPSHGQHQNSHNVHFEERQSRSKSKSKSPRSASSERISRSRSPQVQRKSRPTAESLFSQGKTTDQSTLEHFDNENSGERQDQASHQSDTQQRRPPLSHPRRMPLYFSPKKPPPGTGVHKDIGPTGHRERLDETRNLKRESVDPRSGSNMADIAVSSNKSPVSGEIPLIKVNSQILTRAASEASKKITHSPSVSELPGSEPPVYAEPVALRKGELFMVLVVIVCAEPVALRER